MDSNAALPTGPTLSLASLTVDAKAPKQRIITAEEREAARLRDERKRATRKALGDMAFTSYLPRAIVEEIDMLKIQHDLQNRSQVLKLVFERLLANPDIIKELGL